MSTQEIDLAIADFVAHNTAAAEIFEDLGIDYCCGGRQTLRQACSARGLDLELVLGRLREAAAAPADRSIEPAAMSLTGLIDDILETHHRYLAHALARINSLFNRVCAAHHDNHPELKQGVLVFEGLRTELEAHMFKEEQILFPLIKRIEAGEAPGLAAAGPIQVMESEHSSVELFIMRAGAVTTSAARLLRLLLSLPGPKQRTPSVCSPACLRCRSTHVGPKIRCIRNRESRGRGARLRADIALIRRSATL